MREIKFRSWHKNNKSMCQNTTTNLLDRDYLEFMQYTGMKDIKGKEIYEGDVVRIANESVNDDTFIVEWSDGKEFCVGFALFNFLEYEVIGNIYENAELLEGLK